MSPCACTVTMPGMRHLHALASLGHERRLPRASGIWPHRAHHSRATRGALRNDLLQRSDRPVYGIQFHAKAYAEGPYDRRSPLVSIVYPDGQAQAQADGLTLLASFF